MKYRYCLLIISGLILLSLNFSCKPIEYPEKKENSSSVTDSNKTPDNQDNRDISENNVTDKEDGQDSSDNNSDIKDGSQDSSENNSGIEDGSQDTSDNNSGIEDGSQDSSDNNSGIEDGSQDSSDNNSGIEDGSQDSSDNNSGIEDGSQDSSDNNSDIENGSQDSSNNNDGKDSDTGSENTDNQNDTNVANSLLWTYGITPPSASEIEKSKTRSFYLIKREQNSSWYDCNKVQPGRGGIDSQMCWAASAANMLHWWLEQNKELVEKSGYKRPIAIPDMLSSEIFQYFKDNFKNIGNQTDMALNWFINGKPGIMSLPGSTPPGFFREVFHDNILTKSFDGMDGKSFSETIKNSLLNKEVLCVYYSYGIYSAHAVTIWGAEFDNNERVSYLYICDNNQGSSDKNGTMMRVRIGYKTVHYKNKTIAEAPFMFNSQGNPYFHLYTLKSLSLGREYIK